MREYLLVMLMAAVTTYLLTGLCRLAAVHFGIQAQVRQRDVHTRPTPYLGGLAMLAGVAMAFLLASMMPFLSSHEVVSRDSLGILGAASVICLVGVIDDVLDLPAVAKVAGQVLAAGIAVLNGLVMVSYFRQLREAGMPLAEAVRREIEAQPEYQSFRQQLLKRRQATESR